MSLINHPAPSFTLESVATKRQVGLKIANGRCLIMLFVGYQTAKASEKIVKAIRKQYPSLDTLQMINIIDMRPVPRLMRGVAEGIIKGAYETAKKQIPEGYNPEDYLILLPDWKGNTFNTYGIQDVSNQIALVMIDAKGIVRQIYQDAHPIPTCLTFLETHIL